MADLGAARRQLLVDLDPALEGFLPPARPEPSAHRDYRGELRPGSFPVTAEVVRGLGVDYDLAGAAVRSLSVRATAAGLRVHLTLAAPRRFAPSEGRVATDGSRKPWPAAPLRFSFDDVSDFGFDAEDRVGAVLNCADTGLAVTLGRTGHLLARVGTVWPDDPRWHESAAARAADPGTPHERRQRREPVRAATLTAQQQAAARALHMLMLQVRLVGYYPHLAATVPVSEICRIAAAAGSAILAASAYRGAARDKAFAALEEQWRHVPPHLPTAPVGPGPAVFRFVSYTEPHDDHDVARPGSAVVLAAVPGEDPAAPWNRAGEEIVQPAQFRLASSAFAGVKQVRCDAGALSIDDTFAIHPQDR
ncbi:hypothetical protein Cci01nite_62230 [Catellatospora citrea]|uniref:Uncharacterized protein n=2 Tax=Catellatospora citrea TaxID=53366 RepID=A0A8J3KI23_9ACTN|nr:hypothetical protein Cci01nite_62230 [Catellatospora citrea]